jgi:hypothetical protein
MATKKATTPADEKLEKQDFPLFDALNALDRKDYAWFDSLSEEQQRKFVAFMMIKYMSYLKGSSALSAYYVMSTDVNANKYFFNEYISKHPKLQWLMLCASSPGKGKQFHPWLPQIKEKVSLLKEHAKASEIKEYFKKIYPSSVNDSDLKELADAYVEEHKRKMYLANKFPSMKIADIDLLSQLVTDEEIKQYEKDFGN